MAPRHPDRARAGSGGCAEPRDFAASRTPPAGRGGAGRERHVHTTVESFRSARPRGARAALEYLVRLRARAREGSMAPRFSGFTIQWLHGRRGSGTGPRRRDVRGAGLVGRVARHAFLLLLKRKSENEKSNERATTRKATTFLFIYFSIFKLLFSLLSAPTFSFFFLFQFTARTKRAWLLAPSAPSRVAPGQR